MYPPQWYTWLESYGQELSNGIFKKNYIDPTGRQNFGDAPGQIPKFILTLCLPSKAFEKFVEGIKLSRLSWDQIKGSASKNLQFFNFHLIEDFKPNLLGDSLSSRLFETLTATDQPLSFTVASLCSRFWISVHLHSFLGRGERMLLEVWREMWAEFVGETYDTNISSRNMWIRICGWTLGCFAKSTF